MPKDHQDAGSLRELGKTIPKQHPILQGQIDQKETVDPGDDDEYKQIIEDIKAAEKEVGEPVTDQLTELETKRQTLVDRQTELNTQLADFDQMQKNEKRITELAKREKELSQQIAGIDRMLDMIGEYNAAESKAIESAVNGRFKYVEFKLFDIILNGSVNECCEAMLNGVPYTDMSYGQRIIVGIDIINILSEHYGYSVPLVIDNAESLTLPIEAEGQTIRLVATKSKKLQIELEK